MIIFARTIRKRFLIETVNDQLKNISQIELSRHRSLTGFMVNLVSELIAYTLQSKKCRGACGARSRDYTL
jgi:hypothetical protein